MSTTVAVLGRDPVGRVQSPRSPSAPLASLSLCALLAALGTSIANVGLPTFAQAFGASFQEVQWIVLAYLLAITTSIVSVGRLGDLVGRRRLLLTGITLFTAASVLCGSAPTLLLLIAARAIQGLGAAVMLALTMAFVADTVSKARIGSAMGLLGSMSAIGTALGPSLGGLLISRFGWPSIFLANVPLGLLALGLAYRVLPADRPVPTVHRPDFDILGTLVLASTLAAYALAMTFRRGEIGPLNVALLVAAAFGTGLFLFVEARASAPLIQLTILRDEALRAGLVSSALVSTVMMATLVVGPFYLSDGLGLDTTRVGLLLSIGPLVVALTGVPAGRLADRFGSRASAIIGLAAMGAGCGALALGPVGPAMASYVVSIVVVTVGYALFQTANNGAVMTGLDPDQRGVISGMLNLSRNLGLISGASLMGAVFARAAASTGVALTGAAATTYGMRVTFGVAAALIVMALAVALRGRPPGRPVVLAN